MSAFKPWHRAILLVVLAGLALSLLAWIAQYDPVQFDFLPGDRRAESGLFFPVHLIRVRIGSPASMQRSDASLFDQSARDRASKRSCNAADRSEDQWHFSQLSAEDQLEEDLER